MVLAKIDPKRCVDCKQKGRKDAKHFKQVDLTKEQHHIDEAAAGVL